MENRTLFKNRTDAGHQLAEKLLKYKSEEPLILALPRGGVPVAYEVAKALSATLDTLVVRKIGAPSNPEYVVGAISPGDVIIFNNTAIQSLGLTNEDLDQVIAKEMEEMERRMVHYHSGEYGKDVEVDMIIIVDDGLATGVSARAAIESVKIQEKPGKLIFASPICASDTADALRSLVDDVVCINKVGNLASIGAWYEQFEQTSDEEVISLLEKARGLSIQSAR